MDYDKMIDDAVNKFFESLGTTAKELIDNEEYLSAQDVAKKLGVSVPAARQYMAREHFPKLKVNNGYKVSKVAFFFYNLKERI